MGTTNFDVVACTTLSAGNITGDTSVAYNTATIGNLTSTTATIGTLSGTTSFTALTGGTIVNLDASGSYLTVDGTGASFKLGATVLTASDSALLGGITSTANEINTLARTESGGVIINLGQVTANGTASAVDGSLTVARTTAGVYRITFDATLSAVPVVHAQPTELASISVTTISATGATVNLYTVSSTAAADKAWSFAVYQN